MREHATKELFLAALTVGAYVIGIYKIREKQYDL